MNKIKFIFVFMILLSVYGASQEIVSDNTVNEKKETNKEKNVESFKANILDIFWNGEYFDFTNKKWSKFSNKKQTRLVEKYQKWYAEEKGVPIEKDIEVGGSKFRMVLIPPGKYWMGSSKKEEKRDDDEKRHKVVISKAFWLGKYEVTQKQWFEVTKERPWAGKEYMTNNDEFPATFVSWEDVEKKFLHVLGEGYNLPTEAQWEYACRAGTITKFYWGNSKSEMGSYANVADRTTKETYPTLSTIETVDEYSEMAYVGRFKANGYQLHDMIGNVYEWCRDRYGNYDLSKEIDPLGPATDETFRVIRGGGWYGDRVWNLRCANRVGDNPKWRTFFLGFRLFLEADLK